MHPPDPEHSDILALQGGEEAALDRLMDRHRAAITAFIFRMVGDASDADELAQETFVRAYFQIGSYRPKAPFVAWLYQIARNLCRDHFRSRAYKQRQMHQSMDGTFAELRIATEVIPQGLQERMEKVQSALLKLPVKLRESLILTAIEGLSQDQAATRLGLSTKAVEVRCYRARKELVTILQNF